jgi:2TM domain
VVDSEKQYEKAKKRVEAKIGFFIHLSVYILVNSFLIMVNYFQSKDVIWSVWPLGGWGIGLFFHGLGVFLFPGLDRYKEGMIQKEMGKNS